MRLRSSLKIAGFLGAGSMTAILAAGRSKKDYKEGY
jgi:hypothetical protein